MAAGTAHVVGAGLAGLAASIALADAGWRVALYEAAPAAGGRCRSFDDPRLGCRIDNGNHLVLSGNRATRAYLRRIGSQNALVGPARARLDLIDLADGRRSVLDLLKPDPGRAVDLLRLLCAGPGDTVADRLGASPRFRAIWAPLALAALNTAPQEGSARLFRRVLLETLAFGARPLVARDGLSAAFIDPALAHLRARGAAITFGRRMTGIDAPAERVVALRFGDDTVPLDDDDVAVLALPAWELAASVSGVAVPTRHSAIVNAHFRVAVPDGRPGLIGVLGGTAEWIFARAGVVSVTVSAADRLLEEPAEALIHRLWQDTARALDLASEAMPPARLVKERRATFAALPTVGARRPGPRSRWSNLALAGDWIATNLPATIEGAIRSGQRAAAVFA